MYNEQCTSGRPDLSRVMRFVLLQDIFSRGDEFSGNGTTFPARGNSPSVLEGVPSGGVVILKHQNSL